MTHTSTMATFDRFHSHPLHSFLNARECPVGKSKEATLCGMGAVKGRWLVSDDDYPEFLDMLHDYLFKQKSRPINLVEQPKLDSAKPLLIDLDFKFPVDTALSHQFTKKHIATFVKEVKKGLETFFDLDAYEALRFFVSLRPQAYAADSKKVVKDGIHIQCPDIALTNDKQKVLRSWLLDNQSIEKSFDGIGYVNAVEDIYDESMVRKQAWFFYGESKPSISPYALSSVFAYNGSGAFDEEDVGQYDPRELLELLSIRYNVMEDINNVRSEQKEVFDKKVYNSV